MKKILFLGLILLGMASCNFETTVVGNTSKTITVKVGQYDWKYTNVNNNNEKIIFFNFKPLLSIFRYFCFLSN